MITELTTYVLPILQSIIASRMDSSMNDWAKIENNSDEGKFNLIMKKAFIAAVEKVKGCSPKIIKDNVDELFDDCRDAVLQEILSTEPVHVKAYVEEKLYVAFKNELENCEEAIPFINKAILTAIQQQSSILYKNIQTLQEKDSDIQKATESILKITKKIMGEKGFSACKIIPYIDKTPISLPRLCSDRHSLIDELETLLKTNKALILYAGVKEGKTVASRLLARRLKNNYQIIEIDLAYSNELNLEYIINSYDSSNKYLFILDGVLYDSEQYEAFSDLISRLANEDRLFVINCYDKISDYIFDDTFHLEEKELPPLSLEEVMNMMPQGCDSSLVNVVWGLCQGQPFLTNALCSFLETKKWKMTGEEVKELFTFSHRDSLKKKVKILLSNTIKDDNAYNLLNRLMVVSDDFSEKECAVLASINPCLRNPRFLLDKLLGTWVFERNGKYHLSGLLRKTIEPDLLPQEIKDCYGREADRLLQKQQLSIFDVLTVLNCFIQAGDIEQAGGFYVSMLMKLRDLNISDTDDISLLKAIWIGVNLPKFMSVQMKLSIRIIQLNVLKDLKKQDVDNILNETSELVEMDNIDKEFRSTSIQALAAYCLLNGKNEKAILFQQKWLDSPDCKSILDARNMALVSLDKVETCEELYSWLSLYEKINYPEDDIFSEGALVVINKIYDKTEVCYREKILRDILNHTMECKADIYSVVCAAKLIDFYWEIGKEAEARKVMNDVSGYLASGLGEILLNYSFGLGLCNHCLPEEAYSYLEKAANGKHIEKACMVALNARCTFAQIIGDKGDKVGANALITDLVDHPDFGKIFSLWEQNAALGALSYAMWENGQYKESIKLLLKIEHYLWTVRNNKDSNYINLSIRYVILVLYIHALSLNKTVNEKFALPDYSLFTKQIKSIEKEFKPERNFMKEELLYELAERYVGEDEALIILEHMMDFLREDAAAYAHLLSVMVQAVPLCLAKGRKDIVEYIIATVLSASYGQDIEHKKGNERLVLDGSLLFIVAYRAKCLMAGCSFDEDWLFGMTERCLSLMDDSSDEEYMIDQMLSPTPDYNGVKDIIRKSVINIYHFKRVEFSKQLYLLWSESVILNSIGKFPSAQHFLKNFVLNYAKFLINENPEKFGISLVAAESLFSKVANLENIEYVKKIIQGLYFNVKGNVEVSEEMKCFLYD